MLKLITVLTLLTLSALAGTWLIEGTPTGIPSGTAEETLRLDQTVQQTVSNGAVRVEGKYVYEEAYPPSINFWYYSTTAKEACGANGTVALNPDGTGFTYGSYEVLVYNYLDNGGTKHICTMNAVYVYGVIDGSAEDSYSITINPTGTYLDKGYFDHSTANYSGEGTSSGIIVVVTDLGSGTKYSQILPANTQAIELTDPTFTGWTTINSISDLGTQEILYPSFPGNSYGSQDVFIYSKRIVDGQEFYSGDTHIYYLSTPSVIYNDHPYGNTIYFFSSFSFYQDPSVYSYIVVDWAASKWTEILADGTSNEIWVNVGDQNWFDYWLYTWQAAPTTTPATPLILKPDIILANNEVASVVINGDGQVVSTVSDPNIFAPLVVNSGVKVDNLNVDSLDGYGGDAFVQSVFGTAPISVSAGKTPTVSHLDTNGYKHVPTNGTLNQILKNNGTGIASWGWVTEDKGVLSNASLIVVNASNSVFNTRLSRDTNGVLAITENHTYVATKGYYVKLNGSSIDLGGTVGGGDGSYNMSANWWFKGPPTGATHRIFCNNGNNHYFQISTNVNGTHIDFVYNYYGYTKLNYSHPISSFSSGWNMLTVKKGSWLNSDETVRLYLNGTMISSFYSDSPNWYIDIRYVAGAASSTYAPQYPIDEIAIWFGDFYKNINDTQITELYNVGRGGIPTYMGDYLASAGYYITPAWPYTFQQPQYLFRFDTNDGPQARNAIGNTLCNFTSPGNVAYFEGEVCFKKVPKTQNLISCTGYPTGSVASVTTTIGDNNFTTVIAGSDIKLTPPRWQDTIVSGLAIRAGAQAPDREQVSANSGIYGTAFDVNDDGDYAAQVQHGVASTNISFPIFYYNPHLHVSINSLADPNTNATFVLTYQIAPVNSNYTSFYISRTGTVSWATSPSERHFNKILDFGLITNNALQGADSIVIRGNIKRIATPVIGNDVPTHVFVDSLDYHFPMDSVGSSAIFGDAP